MIALPFKRCVESGGWEAVRKLTESEFGDEGKRLTANLCETLEQKRVAAAVAAEATDDEPSYAERGGEEEEEEEEEDSSSQIRATKRYAAELLVVDRRCPNADRLLGFESTWAEAWSLESQALQQYQHGSGNDLANSDGEKKGRGLSNLLRLGGGSTNGKSLLPAGPVVSAKGAVRLEWAATVYNVACAESAAGVALERSSDRAIRTACRHFQRAAGILEHLRKLSRKGGLRGQQLKQTWGCVSDDETDADSGANLRDLSTPALEMSVHLMLAQAQACFYEKAVAGQDDAESEEKPVKAALIARLAAQVAQGYWRALATLGNGVTVDSPSPPEFVLKAKEQPLLKHPDLESLAPFFEFQARSFEAAAQLWCARQKAQDAEATGEGYGAQLAHLAFCEKHCDAAVRVVVTADTAKKRGFKKLLRVDAEALKGVQALKAHVAATLAEVTADNLAIYRERILTEAELATVVPVSLAKATPPDPALVGYAGLKPKEILAKATKRRLDSTEEPALLFRGLVPRAARSAVEAHADVARRDAREALDRCADADELQRAALASLGLPRELDEFEESTALALSGALPRNLAERARQFRFLRSSDEEEEETVCSSRATLAKAHAHLVSARQAALGTLAEAKLELADASLEDGLLTALGSQLEAAGGSDNALLARLEDRGVEDALATLDTALDREYNLGGQEEAASFSASLLEAVGKCRFALEELRSNSEKRLVAARQLEKIATAETSAAMLNIDELADFGLPLLSRDEVAEDEEGHHSSSVDQERMDEVSVAVRLTLEARYDTRVVPCAAEATASAVAQGELIDRLAASHAVFTSEKRRDPAARAAKEALGRVVDGARSLDELISSLAEGASFYAESARRANQIKGEALNPPPPKGPPAYEEKPLCAAEEEDPYAFVTASGSSDLRRQEEEDAALARQLEEEDRAALAAEEAPPTQRQFDDEEEEEPAAPAQGNWFSSFANNVKEQLSPAPDKKKPTTPASSTRQLQEAEDEELARALANSLQDEDNKPPSSSFSRGSNNYYSNGGGAPPSYGGGSSSGSPSYSGGGAPSYGGGSGPPSYSGGGAPSYGGSSGPPSYSGGGAPSYGGSSGPPSYSGGGAPSYGGGSGPPSYSGGGAPSYSSTWSAPPTSYGGSGSSGSGPPSYGGGGPPSYGGSGSSAPPSYGGSNAPPSYGGSSGPPSYGGSGGPPSYGGAATGSRQPPSFSSTTTPSPAYYGGSSSSSYSTMNNNGRDDMPPSAFQAPSASSTFRGRVARDADADMPPSASFAVSSGNDFPPVPSFGSSRGNNEDRPPQPYSRSMTNDRRNEEDRPPQPYSSLNNNNRSGY